MNKPLIKLENVSKYYKTKTGVSEGMRGINLEFNINEFVAITGESGSGKTTLLNVISGLDSYEDGELFINGEETSHFSVKDFEEFRAKQVGFVFQNYNVIDSYTVYQNVAIALEVQGYDKTEIKKRANDLIDRVGLSSHTNHRTSKLSGGQKQRVVIARALAKNAPIILADEPTGNLDEKSSKEIMELLKEISKDKLVILVTHNFKEAKDYVTRNVVMSDGAIKNDFKLVKTENKEIELSDINRKNSFFSKTLKIASRNVLTTPKRTIFNLLLSMIIVFAFVYFYSGLIKETADGLVNGADATILRVINRSDEDISDLEFRKIKDYGYKNTKVINMALDKVYDGINKNLSSVNSDVLVKENFVFLNDASLVSSIYYGREIKNKNEVVISIDYKEDNSNEIGKTITILGSEYKIVGIGNYSRPSVNDSIKTVYMHEDVLYTDNRINNNIIEYYKENITLTEGTIEDFIKYNEISIKATDRRELKLIKEKINNDTYQVIDNGLIFEQQIEFIRGTILLLMWMVLIGILSVIFLAIYQIQKNVMETRKKDFAVYRSIGISEKEVGMVVLLEQVIIAIISVVLMYILLFVLSKNLVQIAKITRNVTTFDYLVIALVFAIFSLYQGLKFNKKIFNVTVIESLKEDF